MSSIDYLKFLLKKEEKTDEEREEDMQREEAYLISQGVIPKQRTIDPKIYDKLPEGFKGQFFNPHKTYDSDDKYKAIDKLKALLNKGKFGKDIKDIRLIQDKCTHCGKKMSGDVSASIGSKEYIEGRQCKNCKKQEKQDYDKVSTYFDLTSNPEYLRQKEEWRERRSRGENVGNFKFKKPRNKSIDKLKALLDKANKVGMDTRNSKQQPDRNASDDEGSHTWYGVEDPRKDIPPSRVAGTAESHPVYNKKDKIRSEFSQYRADRLPKTDVIDAETGDVIDEVSDDSGEYPEFHHQRSISPNVARKLKSIDKLKALLAKEGETNSGEKSHIEDKERQEKETKTPENLLTWSRVKREFDDETHEDPY